MKRRPLALLAAAVLALPACRADREVAARGAWSVVDRPGSATSASYLGIATPAYETQADAAGGRPYRPRLVVPAALYGDPRIELSPRALGLPEGTVIDAPLRLDGAPAGAASLTLQAYDVAVPRSLLAIVRGHRRMTLRLARARGAPTTVTFDIDGLGEMVDAIDTEAQARAGDDWPTRIGRALR